MRMHDQFLTVYKRAADRLRAAIFIRISVRILRKIEYSKFEIVGVQPLRNLDNVIILDYPNFRCVKTWKQGLDGMHEAKRENSPIKKICNQNI